MCNILHPIWYFYNFAGSGWGDGWAGSGSLILETHESKKKPWYDKLHSISEYSKLAKTEQQNSYKLSMLTALNAPHIKPGLWVTYYLSGHIQRNISSISKKRKTMLKIICNLLRKDQRRIMFTTHCNSSWIIFLIFLLFSSSHTWHLLLLKLSAPPFQTLSKPPSSVATSPLPPLHSEFFIM